MTVFCNRSACSWDQILWLPAPSLTVVMAFRAVSAPMLRSEPGTLLETVAGTMTMGTQNSSYFPRAINNSSSDRKACRAEPRALVSAREECWQVGLVVEVPQGRERQKWRVPREGARSITTDSSETDRCHSTYSEHYHCHTHIHSHTWYPLTLHTSQENKAGEPLNRSAWNGWKKASALFPIQTKSSDYLYFSQMWLHFSFKYFKCFKWRILLSCS